MAFHGWESLRSFAVLVVVVGVCLVHCAPSQEPAVAVATTAGEAPQETDSSSVTEVPSPLPDEGSDDDGAGDDDGNDEDDELTTVVAPPTTAGEVEPEETTVAGADETTQGDDATTSVTTQSYSTPTMPSPTTPEIMPKMVNFTLRDDNDEACLKAVFSAWMKVAYYSGKKKELREAQIPLPPKAKVGGRCGDIYSQSILRLEWAGGKYSLKITFQTDQSNSSSENPEEGTWCAKSIQFTYDTSDSNYFDDAVDAGKKTVQTFDDITLFDTPLKSSYLCETQDNIAMESKDEEDKVIMRIADLQLQPYEIENGEFSEGNLCEADKENQRRIDSTVPIAVGAALGCLILLVIIVYAIGRRFGALGTGYSGYKSVD
ncbi:lysosome-associated membrane glycoprotein 5-like [Ptychodera flava]|uniref:lysosome-associated membrane glycoprotein 5-like n=1 Tax=Ptychodera flava TaxID=63121 RepID=UPI00396A3398